jgi:hypothetical protein
MDLIDIEDGRIAGNNIYYDQLTFAREIGMIPPEGSLGDRLMTCGFNLVTKGRAKVRERARRSVFPFVLASHPGQVGVRRALAARGGPGHTRLAVAGASVA